MISNVKTGRFPQISNWTPHWTPGLRLCTSTGVLQEGQAGTDVAVAVARTAANLDTRGAKATSEGDRQMIHAAWQR